jgi:hypothetical protein
MYWSAVFRKIRRNAPGQQDTTSEAIGNDWLGVAHKAHTTQGTSNPGTPLRKAGNFAWAIFPFAYNAYIVWSR